MLALFTPKKARPRDSGLYWQSTSWMDEASVHKGFSKTSSMKRFMQLVPNILWIVSLASSESFQSGRLRHSGNSMAGSENSACFDWQNSESLAKGHVYQLVTCCCCFKLHSTSNIPAAVGHPTFVRATNTKDTGERKECEDWHEEIAGNTQEDTLRRPPAINHHWPSVCLNSHFGWHGAAS